MKLIKIRKNKRSKKTHLELFKAACGVSKSIVVRFFCVKLFSMVGNKFMVVAD